MAATTSPQLSAGTWLIDPLHSSLTFFVRHLMVNNVRGRFDRFSGSIVITEDGAASVSAEIQADSVNSGSEQRDEHIKSPEFFDAQQYPVASFSSTAVQPNGDRYAVKGDFTLKGVTKPITLDLKFNGKNPGMGRGEVAGFEASVVLNRKDFGINLDLPLETGVTVLGEKVTITLDIEALKQT